MMPLLDTVPYVDLSPTTPQNEAGCRIDPPVSLPNETSAPSIATAATDPPDVPPGTRDVSTGFLVFPYAPVSVDEPIANSSIFVRPKKTTPSFFNCFIIPPSYVAL